MMTPDFILAVLPTMAKAALSLSSILVFFGILLLAYMGFLRLITHWSTLVRRFPTTGVHPLGKKYQKQAGFFGNIKGSLSGQFEVELAEEGLLVTTWFAKGSTILIHWHDIRDVAIDASQGAILTVDYKTELKFTIPTAELATLHESIPAERFHKAPSLLELLKNRLAGR